MQQETYFPGRVVQALHPPGAASSEGRRLSTVPRDGKRWANSWAPSDQYHVVWASHVSDAGTILPRANASHGERGLDAFHKGLSLGFPCNTFFFPNPTLQHKFIPGVSSCVSSPGDPGVLLSRSKSLVCSRWLLSRSGCIFIKRANAMICKT